jgi:GT2 family glycosyltransferase
MQSSVLSIVIVNWRSKEYLRGCLRSIEKTCAKLAPQIVVVDNGSFDGCGEMVAREFAKAEFVQCPSNGGFARANNLGFTHVRGRYLLLLNPDTELLEGAVQALIACLERDPSAGLAAPRLLNSDGSLQASCVRSTPTPLKRAMASDLLDRLVCRCRWRGKRSVLDSVEPVAVEAVSGACMLLKASTYRRVGGLREEFFMYGEDMDLCARIRRMGLSIFHVPKAVVVHHGGGSSASQSCEFTTAMLRSAGETYFRLNHGELAAISYRILEGVSGCARIVWGAMLWCCASGAKRVRGRACLLKGYFVVRWALGWSRCMKTDGRGQARCCSVHEQRQ